MENYEPLVSIIIPVYNGSNYMREAIDSAIAQTYKNKEIIVVNDGSNDNGETERIAKSYGNQIIYFCKPNGGCASALNYGISMMHGEWFSWLSHDDKYYPEKIKRSIEFIAFNGLRDGKKLVYCNSDLIDDVGKIIFHPIAFQTGNFDSFALLKGVLFGYSINGCALLINKKILDDVGEFDEQLKYTPDFDYWIRVALKGYGMASFDEKLCSNRVHAGQVSVQSKDRMRPDIGRQIVKISEFADEDSTFNIEMLKLVWLFSYSRGYTENKFLLEELSKRGENLKPLLRKGSILKISNAFVSNLKAAYRLLFKKGMN